MRTVSLLKRASREFLRNLLWMLLVFGLLGAILVFATQLPLLGVAIYIGIFASVLAAIVTAGCIDTGLPAGRRNFGQSDKPLIEDRACASCDVGHVH